MIIPALKHKMIFAVCTSDLASNTVFQTYRFFASIGHSRSAFT